MKTLDVKRRRDLALRKWQYGAAGLTIFLGTMAYAASYDAYRNLDGSYRRMYRRLALADVTVTGADPTFAATAQHLAGVDVVQTRRQADVPFRVDGERTFVGRLVGMPAGNEPDLDRVQVLRGDDLGAESIGAALVERHMFDYFEMDVGDSVEYFDGTAWQAVEVAGSVASAEYLWPARSAQDALSTPDSFGVMFVHDSALAPLPPSVVENQALVGYKRGAATEHVDAAVRRAASRAGASSVVVVAEQPSNKALQSDVLGFRQMAYAFPALFLVAAAVATYTLMVRLVYQERELIGTLRANGLSRSAVVSHYLSYGIWLGGLAGLLGVSVGIPLGWLMTTAYTAQLGITDTLRGFHPTTVLVGGLFGVLTGLVSAWIPARDAARQQPADAMRGEVATAGGGLSMLERTVPALRHLPARWRIVLRGIGRNRRRSLSTLLGVVLALVLIMAAWGMLDSTRFLLLSQYDRVQTDDATLVFTGPVDDGTVSLVESIGGVSAAERVVALPASVRRGRDSYATQLMAFEQGTRMHDFGRPLPREGVVLGESFRSRLDLEEGDRIALTFTSLGVAIRVRVARFVSEPLGTFAYMRLDALETALGEAAPPVPESRLRQPETSVVLARFKSGADRESVLERLKQVEGVAAARDSHQLQQLLEDYMALFYVFIGFMMAFGGVLAFALLFNAMWANLAERATEIATMRANGLSRRQVAQMVVWENMLLTLLGIPVGLVAGYAVSDALLSSYATDSWTFELHFAPMTYVWCVIAMIAIALSSLAPSLRANERLDIGSIVRQRSA